jgi:hypothetical protein
MTCEHPNELLTHRLYCCPTRSTATLVKAARARSSAAVGLVVLLLSLLAGAATAHAGTPYVDGISDQSLPVWNGSFTTSAFARSFRTSWVGQIAFARYALQWNAMAEASAGANADGDYRERFEAWLEDVRSLGLKPVIALTSYTGAYPDAGVEYQQGLEELLGAADRYDAPVGYVEAWNEPNNQGDEPAGRAGEIANWANAVCMHLGCQVIAGDFEDSPSLAAYQQAYISALQFSPLIWGIHPYRSVKAHSDEAIVRFEQALPDHGARAQIWFTEVGAYYCAHRQVLGEAQQAADASYLLDTLIPAIAPAHVFYYGFMAGDDAEVPCSTGAGEDSELYRASGAPRAAASVIFAGPDRPLELSAGLSGGLAPFD